MLCKWVAAVCTSVLKKFHQKIIKTGAPESHIELLILDKPSG